VKDLAAVVWADGITVRRYTRISPYRLVFGQDYLFPVKLGWESWAVVDWASMKSREDLLAARARQLERRMEDVQKAVERLRKSREKNKEYFDENRRTRPGSDLQVGDLVLLFDPLTDISLLSFEKLSGGWARPYYPLDYNSANLKIILYNNKLLLKI
jgi:hypothetical protein